MSEIKLLPCPFCGGKIKLDEDDFYMFCCDTCGAGITFAHELEDGAAEDCTKEESIERYNTRKPMDRIVEQLEEQQNINRRINHDDIINIGLDQAIMIVKSGAKQCGVYTKLRSVRKGNCI